MPYSENYLLNGPTYRYRDRLRHDWRIMRYMIRIAQQELKRMSAWGKRNICFCLSRSEV